MRIICPAAIAFAALLIFIVPAPPNPSRRSPRSRTRPSGSASSGPSTRAAHWQSRGSGSTTTPSDPSRRGARTAASPCSFRERKMSKPICRIDPGHGTMRRRLVRSGNGTCRRPKNVQHWPAQTDAPELRKLLEDKDPAMRCVAAEALATLHEPEDVGRIGRLLNDPADGVPALGWNSEMLAFVRDKERYVAGGLDRVRSWHSRNVATTASVALKLMTGEDLTAKNFDKWWESNRGGRNCLVLAAAAGARS